MAALLEQRPPLTSTFPELTLLSPRKIDLYKLTDPTRSELRDRVAGWAASMEEYVDTCLQHSTHSSVSSIPHPDFPDIRMRGQCRDSFTPKFAVEKTDFSRSADPRVISTAQPRLQMSLHFPGENGTFRTMNLMMFEGGDMRVTGIERVVTGSRMVLIDKDKEVEVLVYGQNEETVDSRDFDSLPAFLAKFNSDNPQDPTVIESILEKIYQQVA